VTELKREVGSSVAVVVCGIHVRTSAQTSLLNITFNLGGSCAAQE
jgi:hypothetical protein